MSQLTGRVDAGLCEKFEAGLEVCATDIDAYLKANLFAPLGMNSSGYVWETNWEKQAARPHDSDGKPQTKARPSAASAARYASSGGLNTTATDYGRFLVEVVAPKRSDAFRLNQASHAEMLRPQVKLDPETRIDDATSWALGWAIRERPEGNLIVHSGGQTGFKSLAVASVEKQSGFIVLTNGEDGWKVFHDAAFIALTSRWLAT